MTLHSPSLLSIPCGAKFLNNSFILRWTLPEYIYVHIRTHFQFVCVTHYVVVCVRFVPLRYYFNFIVLNSFLTCTVAFVIIQALYKSKECDGYNCKICSIGCELVIPNEEVFACTHNIHFSDLILSHHLNCS